MSKRILLVSPMPTDPATAGNSARIGAMIAGMRTLGHDVQFLHVERELGDRRQMRNRWGEAYHYCPYHPPHRRGRRFWKGLQGRLSVDMRYRYGLDDWWDDSASETISALHSKFNFDVAIAEYVFFSKALECFDRSVLKILDTHDVFTDRHRIYLEQGMSPQWFSTSAKEESKGLNRADIVFAIQDQERKFFSTLTRKPVVTIGHIVTLSAPAATPETKSILYVGSKNRINVESILRFVRDVFPMIRARVPSAVLFVAGGVCDELGEYDAVVKCGNVDSLEQLYASVNVVVNPVVFGTGLKIKSLEALGYGKPLITTAAGATGLEEGAGRAFSVADQADDFANAVINMLTDCELNAAFAHRAYGYASAWNQRVLAALNAAVSQDSSSVRCGNGLVAPAG